MNNDSPITVVIFFEQSPAEESPHLDILLKAASVTSKQGPGVQVVPPIGGGPFSLVAVFLHL